tara:strand:+ start:171 stop:467 length:297 start_codon:yes stop_codon:yes gene_type:complete
MIVYDNASIYISSKASIKEKIEAIDQVINALEETALRSATKDDINEYWLDDGQTKIKTVYKSTSEVVNSISSLITLKEYYLNKYHGRVFRLKDITTFR